MVRIRRKDDIAEGNTPPATSLHYVVLHVHVIVSFVIIAFVLNNISMGNIISCVAYQ